MPAGMRPIVGACALGYVAGVGIENMGVLEAPTIGGPVADIRAEYGGDKTFNVVTATAGALALAFYCVFAAGLAGLLRARERAPEAWTFVALTGAVGGPAVAAVGAVATAVLVSTGGAGLSDGLVRTLFDVHLLAQMVAGIFVALFLVGVGVAGLRSGGMPRWLAGAACAIAAAAVLFPMAAFIGDHTLHVLVTIGYGAYTLWVLAAGLWLILADGSPVVVTARRAAFVVLVLAAGLVGLGLLAAPGATGKFFSWGLEPDPLAALSGGFYVGAATVFALGVWRPWRQVRGLVAGAVVLSVSVLAITLVHLEIFDFDRLQAWAWLVLFVAFSVVTAAIFLLTPRDPAGGGPRVAAWSRWALAGIAVVLGAIAVALWVDPRGVADASPFALPPLGGRFAGSWIALTAVLAGWAALSERWEEARLPALGVVALPAGALLAALRTLGDLQPDGTRAAYLAALGALVLAGTVVVARGRAAA